MPCIVAANKVDMKINLTVQEGQVRLLCEGLGASFPKTSARTGDNVQAAFSWLLREILERSKVALAST